MATFRVNKQSTTSHQDMLPKREPLEKKSLHFYGILIVSMVVSIAGISFLYLIAFNTISSQGIIIVDLGQERNKLMIENEVWNMRISKLKSLDVIEKQSVVKNMQDISPAEIEFVKNP